MCVQLLEAVTTFTRNRLFFSKRKRRIRCKIGFVRFARRRLPGAAWHKSRNRCAESERGKPSMSFAANGELIPVGGGDSVPLIRPVLTIGRRESCDICLRQANVSGLHCELTFRDGHWLIKDLGSTNGVKVNGIRVPKKVLHPGDVITIAKRNYTIEYTPLVGKHALEEML